MEDRPQLHSALASYELDDDLIVYDEQSSEGFVLNATAAHIVQLLDGSRTVAAVARVIAQEYGVEYQQALTDVRELISELREASLLATDVAAANPEDRAALVPGAIHRD
ncbi:MAG: hypothetical protein QOF51_1719 [Chloroflexota bacterium]|jgi:PqqD family protein of HPr-rel-A system|nr:hypothetical protein [Chloroflexota bacterium]